MHLPEEVVNVFMLDHDPVQAARMHCDKHVVKMILETAQLLSTAWHCLHNPLHNGEDEETNVSAALQLVVSPAQQGDRVPAGNVDGPLRTGDRPFYTLHGQRIYTCTHRYHPCAVWARECRGNYDWLWRLGMALLEEYTFRYGRRHASAPVIWTLEAAPPGLPGPVDAWTEVPPAMPDECKVVVDGYFDTVASYRQYYTLRKAHLLTWTRRAQPSWYSPAEELA